MALNELDPDASVIGAMMSRTLADAEVIKRQRTIIFGLVSALKAERLASNALTDLLDELLAGDG